MTKSAVSHHFGTLWIESITLVTVAFVAQWDNTLHPWLDSSCFKPHFALVCALRKSSVTGLRLTFRSNLYNPVIYIGCSEAAFSSVVQSWPFGIQNFDRMLVPLQLSSIRTASFKLRLDCFCFEGRILKNCSYLCPEMYA